MVRLRLFLLFFVLLQQLSVNCQTTDSSLKSKFSILQIDDQTDQSTIDDLAETIVDLSHNPIDLNNAERKDLERLTMLNDFQIVSLWNYLEKNRPLLSIYEIRAVMGFDSKDFASIKTYICCNPVEKTKAFKTDNIFTILEQYGESTIDDSVVTNPKYLGKPAKTLIKYQADISKHLQITTSAEKDPSEHFGKQGFDFYSGNICFTKYKWIKRLVIGDYSLHFGQGLVAWNGNSFRNYTDVRKRGEGLIPYKSIDENRFYRGAAITLIKKQMEATFFTSSHFIDGIIDTANNSVSSFPITGYHRSLSELKNKHTVRWSSFGANGNYRFKYGSIGITNVSHFFNKNVYPSDKAYNAFTFRGKAMSMIGSNIYIHFKRIDLFGEAAINQLLKPAMTCGGEFFLSEFLQCSILLRDYSPGYYSFMNAGYSTSGKTTNEQGIYFALRAKIDSLNAVVASIDFFKHPWLLYSVYGLSNGSITTVSYEHSLPHDSKIVLQYKYSNKPINNTASLQIKSITQLQEQRIKAALTTKMQSQWQFITQTVCVFANSLSSPSIFVSQDVDYSYNTKLSFGLRYAVFDASSSAGISIYESDVRVGTSSTFSGDGDKFYCKINYLLLKNLQCSAKFATVSMLNAKLYTTKNEYSMLVKLKL